MEDNRLKNSGSSVAPVYPLTNRGTLRPQKAVFKGFDYLRITRWDNALCLMDELDSGVLEKYAPEAVRTWRSIGPGRRAAEVFVCDIPGLTVEVAPDADDSWQAGVLFKGKACTALGNPAILEYVSMLDALGVRWQASRVDLAWDGFPLSPKAVFDHLEAGNVRTRAKFNPDFQTNKTGDTCYTHLDPELNGVERYCIFYNMRGPTRCELRMKRRYAKPFMHSIVGITEDELQGRAMSALVGFMELVRPGSERVARRPLLAAWKRFTENVEPWRPDMRVQVIEREGLELLGTYEQSVQRCAKAMSELVEAFGPEYVIKRIEHYGHERVRLDRVEKLKAIRSAAASKGIAAVPPWPEEYDDGEGVPF